MASTMPTIDFHSHFFSHLFFETLAALSPQPGPVEDKLARLAARTGIELPPRDPTALAGRWLAEMGKNGVERMMTFASLPEEIPAVAEAVRAGEGRLSACALVNPRIDGCADLVESLLASGEFRGVLLFPAMHHFHPAGREAVPVFEVLERYAAPVFVHCGVLIVRLRDLLGLPRPYDLSYANPLGLVPVANRFREVKFILPHFGAGLFREALMAGMQCENIHVDTSSSNSWMHAVPGIGGLAEVFRRALRVFGHERILFGTDSGTFPAGWRADRRAEQQQALAEAGATPEQQQGIFAGNAARLLAGQRSQAR